MFKTLILASAAIFAADAASSPKTIATGWDIIRMTPERIVANADKLDRTPFDGVGFVLNSRDGWFDEYADPVRAMTDRVWDYSALEHYVPVFKEAVRHKSLRNSFLSVYFQPTKRVDWTDDAAWARFATNLRIMARLAKAGGLKGLILDTEDYWKVRQYEYFKKDGMDYDEVRALARRRGRETFSGVFEEFPDIHILSYWWLSINYDYAAANDPMAVARGIGDLLPAFTDGVLDVMPWTVRFLDGNEHTYHWRLDRSFNALHLSHQELITPENRAKFRACLGASVGFYLDMYVNPEFHADGTRHGFYMGPTGGRRLNRFLDRYEDACFNSEEYIWLYGERRSCVDWGNFEWCKQYVAAYTNGTWDAALPGFNEELSILKDPRGALLPRLRKMKFAGKLSNCATNPLADANGRRYTCEVRGVSYGEWYAVLVEMKSDYPVAGIGLSCNGQDVWDRPTAGIVFSRPDENGIWRGIGFQRIWGNADTLKISCGSGSLRTTPKDLHMVAYRLFAPVDLGVNSTRQTPE